MKRVAVFVVAAVVVVTVGAVLAVWRSGPDSPHIVIGKLDDFPVGSITSLDVEAKVTGYVPVVSENSGSQVVDVSIFLVNDPAVGFLALYARDPHKGCRVGLASELPPDTGWELSAEVVFLTPCHGEEYDGVGGHISGPAPRGLDRFAVLVKGGEVIVDVAAFEYGPDR